VPALVVRPIRANLGIGEVPVRADVPADLAGPATARPERAGPEPVAVVDLVDDSRELIK
jgi:hypothetical protein